jgi:hypothetical protein
MATRTARLDWTDLNSGGAQEDEFRVYRSTASFDSSSLPAVLATVAADVVTYDDTTAVEGLTYFYGVAAVKGVAIALSSVVSVTIGFVSVAVRLDLSLSSGDLEISPDRLGFVYNGFNAISGAKTNYARATGKFYFETVVDNLVKDGSNNFATVGLQRIDFDYDLQGISALGVGVYLAGTASGRLWINGSIAVDLGVSSDGDVFGFAVDLDADLIWVRRNTGNWNASGTANPATGVGGLSIADLAGRAVTPASTVFFVEEQHSYNFIAADFVYTAPSGFLEWPTDVSGDNSLGTSVLDSVRNINVTMSGGNLTATRTAVTAAGRSRDYQKYGRYYAEFTVNAWAGTGDCVGLVRPEGSAGDIVGGLNGCYCYRSGALWSNGASAGVSLGTVANGQRVDMAVDFDANLIWFRRAGGNWNNSGSADPATGVGGIAFSFNAMAPCIGFGGSGGANGNNVTANLGASAFGGTPPSGFNAGWPVQAAAAVELSSIWVGAIE